MDAAHAAARRMHELVEPIHLVTYFADEPTEALQALGCRGYWDGYFAGRAAPLGTVPAAVVDALFYNFGPGEVARHVPRVWSITTPEAAWAARQQGVVAALRRVLGDLADGPGLARAADGLAEVAVGAPAEGRAMYAALRTLGVPDEPVARLWHAATMLREHRGDGHVAALVAEGVGRTECHVLLALDQGIVPARSFGRIHHLPGARLDEVLAGMQERGWLDEDELLTDAGRAVKARVEEATDRAASAAYAMLGASELDRLVADLAPLSARLVEAGSR